MGRSGNNENSLSRNDWANCRQVQLGQVGSFLSRSPVPGRMCGSNPGWNFLGIQRLRSGTVGCIARCRCLGALCALAIWLGKIPFAAPTEYEKRRTYAQAKLSVRIPRSGDKTKGGRALGVEQVDLEDSSDESIRAAVGRAYCLGDQDLQNFCSQPWIQDVKLKISLAQMQLVPPAMSFSGISTPPGLMDWSQEDR